MAEKSEVIPVDTSAHDDEYLQRMVQGKVRNVLHHTIRLLKS
jgi:hypothetical protein